MIDGIPNALRLAWLSAGAACAMTAATAACAQQSDARSYDLPAQDLATSLRAVAKASGRSIIASAELLAGKTAPALRGRFTSDQAAAIILAGSGLEARPVGADLVVVTAAGSDQTSITEDAAPDIVVTGTRIRGGQVASAVIEVDQETLRNTAISDTGEAVLRIPQSFGGGQNPGIGMNVPLGSGVDVGGSSSVNLRGLGSDATLTLLNGRRLAYTAVKQSIDVSAIPVSAIKRIEVVPDGASAIYGSDAVAGVANIILRRDYDGLETSARLAASTDGGNFQQQYGALAGTVWSNGGVLAAYDYGSNTAIRARDRAYAADRSPGLDLFPAMRHHSVIASGHQSLGGGVSLEVDGLYNIRWSDTVFPTTPSGDLAEGRATFSSVDKSYAIAPAFRLDLPGDWRVTLTGSYGKNQVDYDQVECARDDCSSSGPSYYRNTARSLELNADGPLFRLPGGSAKLALGGGYREISFRRFASGNDALNTVYAQDSYYAFGELSLPLVAPDQGAPFAHRLEASAAVRYERYPGIGDVLTPKLGIVWGITPDIDLKGSWGKSFRAPTLYQQYQPRAAYLFPPAALGAVGAPTSASALLIVGGNPDLEPERATTWSGTLALHPRSLPGARLELSYFSVVYRDRIVAPIALTREALSNPIYRDQILLNPTESDLAAVIGGAGTFLNLTGVPYDPANVIAIIDNANVNAGRQTARGIDALASYTAAIAPGQQLSFTANVAYLDSDQQLSPDQPIFPLAGIIFNPPHWRGQATAGWSNGALTITGAVNHTGGVSDARFDPAVAIDGMTSFDLTARYQIDDGSSLLDGLDVTLSLQNLFNATPDPIDVSIPYDTPYDSTNYSPVGRLIAVQVRKTW